MDAKRCKIERRKKKIIIRRTIRAGCSQRVNAKQISILADSENTMMISGDTKLKYSAKFCSKKKK